jgi:glucose/arabinose dehydrogenase
LIVFRFLIRGKRMRRITKRIILFLLAGMLALSACSGSPASSTAVPTLPSIVLSSPTEPVNAQPATAQPTIAPFPATATQPATSLPGNSATPTPTTSGQPQATATQAVAATSTAAVPAAGKQAGVPTDTVTTFPDPNGFTWAPVVTGLTKPLGLASLPDGSGKMFVLEQPGTIRVVQSGGMLPDPLMDIRDRVGSQGTEQGLLGIALHPDFLKNGFFYVNYTDVNGNTVIARFQASPPEANRADPGSEKVLLRVDQPFPNHNGGSMVFGPDGYLYMGLGDGGSAGDPHGNGQSTNVLLGKLLRIDVNGGDPYSIPPANPFAKGGGKPEIWAYGLRNPWRFSFDRLTGDLYIADVGQDTWEEIDFQPAGLQGGVNYGWRYREGAHPFQGSPPPGLKLTDPVVEYSHSDGCSVTGGYVYRGSALPEFRGIYLFSDYCSGNVWGLLRGADGSWQMRELFQTGYNVTSFGQDTNSEIYLIDQASGTVFRLQRK